MTVFESIAAVIYEYESDNKLKNHLNNIIIISEELTHELHLFIKSSESDRALAILTDLMKENTYAFRPIITHQIHEDLLDYVGNIIKNFKPELFMIPRDEKSSFFSSLLQRVSTPLFLLEDKKIQFPPNSLFVPLSGERRRSAALEFALRIGSHFGIPINLIHITCGEEGYCSCCSETPMENLTDQSYYEYAHRMDRILAESCPFSTLQERKWVRELCGCSGDIAEQVTRIVSQTPNSGLILEWSGTFVHGRARQLRAIFERAHSPIFLVRVHADMEFKLKVAKNFKAP